jgi:hypothetical protein
MGTDTPPQTATPIRTPGAAGRVQGVRTPMLRTVGEAAADIREHNLIATARLSAVGAATLTARVVDGVRARRVRVAGGVAAVAADGAAEVAVVVLAAGGSGRV